MAVKSGGPGKFVPSGVPGLDEALGGGILAGSPTLVQGAPGAGKTTVGLQFLFACADRGVPTLYVSLTEGRSDLERACMSHGWDLSRIEIVDLSRSHADVSAENQYTVFAPSEVQLGNTTRAILAEVERTQPRAVVFDGLTELRMLAGDALRYRHELLALKAFFEDRGITALLLTETAAADRDTRPESLVSANIVMECLLPGYGGARRRLSITKVRGVGFTSGYHDYDILPGGVCVFPRMVAADHSRLFAPTLVPSGVPGLDAMLHGGLLTGSTTLILGPAGVGKSTIAMQFVAQRLESGGRAAVYLFDETLETMLDRTMKLCDDGVRSYVESGALHAQQVNPAELSPGAFACEVRRAVEEGGADVVVVDSINGFVNAMPDERFLSTHLHELFTYLNMKGVLTIAVVAQHGLMGSPMRDLDVSYLADTALLLRYFELDGAIRQAIGVFKNRLGPHERTLRPLEIGAGGVAVGKPLVGFRGIMTGVPEYLAERTTPQSEGTSP